MRENLRGIVVKIGRTISYYLKSVARDYFADDVFFHSSALSFQVVLCLIPTTFLIIWILGAFLSRETLIRQIEVLSSYALPRRIHSVDEIRRMIVGRADIFTRHKGLFGVVGFVAFLWTSLGLIGTLRKSVVKVLASDVDISFLKQTFYDLRVLLVGGFFLTASTVVTAFFAVLREFALYLPHGHLRLAVLRVVVPMLSGFGLTFLLYFSIYRFISYGRLGSFPAAFGALWAALFFELAKQLFTIYITRATTLSQVYGTLEVVVGLLIWIFYSTTVFMLGAELAHANSRRRALS